MRGFNEIIIKSSSSSAIRTRNKRLGIVLLSTRRKTSQTFEITGRALKRRIYWKSNSRERDRSKRDILDPYEKEAQTTQGPFLEEGDLQTCHKGRQCHELEESRWKLALEEK